jgi:arginine metabolism regulation protein II
MKLELSQDDTQMLLKHTKDHCFPQLWSSPLGKKSPLETHLTAAVLTFASMTYLAPRQISHASFTNVLALLAISSKHLAAQIRNEDSDKSEHWNQYAESAYQKAKQHLDYSLSTEVSPKVAKYKDLIMAVSTIVSFSVRATWKCSHSESLLNQTLQILYDRQSDSRKYLIDAERLLLNQGLPKPHISRKI